MTSSLRNAALLLAVVVLPSCNDSTVSPPRVDAIDVHPEADTLVAIGHTRQFSAMAWAQDGLPIREIRFSWASQNPSIATVDSTGLVAAKTSGTTTISAIAGGVTGTATVVVDQEIDRIAFAIQPGNAVAGEPITPAVAVEFQDAGGTRVSDAQGAVTLTLDANPGSATLAGTRTITSAGGLATFADLSLDKAASGYTLTATATEVDAITSTPFTVGPGPVQLSFLTQPTAAEGQVPFDPIVQVRAAEDRFGNSVPSAAVTVTLAVSPLGETLRGTTTVTAVNGVASFSGLSLALPGDGFVIEATSGTATPVRSGAFSVRLTFTHVSTEGAQSCALTVAWFAYCWGSNIGGQLGDGTTVTRLTPTPVHGGMSFVQISVGGGFSCALDADGDAYCWGYNSFGQLGDGTTVDRLTPTPVTGSLKFVQINAGALHACGVTTSHVAYCWGYNDYGQLGDGTTVPRSSPTPVAGDQEFVAVSASELHTCGVTAGNAPYCWGENQVGELGDGTTTRRFTPTAVEGNLTVVALSAGQRHACVITTSKDAYCWGANFFGQVGDGGPANWRVTPSLVAGGLQFVQLDANGLHTCAVTQDNAAYCWGDNLGQLGDGTTTGRFTPTPVAGDLDFSHVTGGTQHSCGITTDNVAYCWGDNDWGQLGDGSTERRLTPGRVVQ